jgi:hypothetical protein
VSGTTRRELFALALGGVAAGAVASSAAADSYPDGDLAQVRIVLTGELLAAQFYTQLAAAKVFRGDTAKAVDRALFNENEHYQALARIIASSGGTPAAAQDYDYNLPADTFETAGAAAKLAVQLETTMLGAALAAVDVVQTPSLKTILARTAANEAEHRSVFSGVQDNRPIGISFPNPVDEETATAFLDTYLG